MVSRSTAPASGINTGYVITVFVSLQVVTDFNLVTHLEVFPWLETNGLAGRDGHFSPVRGLRPTPRLRGQPQILQSHEAQFCAAGCASFINGRGHPACSAFILERGLSATRLMISSLITLLPPFESQGVPTERENDDKEQQKAVSCYSNNGL